MDRERQRQQTLYNRAMQLYARSPSSSTWQEPRPVAHGIHSRQPAPLADTPVRAWPHPLLDWQRTPSGSPTSWVTVDLSQPPPTLQQRAQVFHLGMSEPLPAWSPVVIVGPSVFRRHLRPRLVCCGDYFRKRLVELNTVVVAI